MPPFQQQTKQLRHNTRTMKTFQWQKKGGVAQTVRAPDQKTRHIEFTVQTLLLSSYNPPAQLLASTYVHMLKIPNTSIHMHIPLSGHTKILHTEWVGMGSAALAAAVTLHGYGVPNFPQEINKVLKKQRDIYLLSYEALPTTTTTPRQYLSRALLGQEKITPCFSQFDTPPIFKLYHYGRMDNCIKKEREKKIGNQFYRGINFFP